MPRASCPILKLSNAVKGFVGVPNRRSRSPLVPNKNYQYLPLYGNLGSFKPNVGFLSTVLVSFLEGDYVIKSSAQRKGRELLRQTMADASVLVTRTISSTVVIPARTLDQPYLRIMDIRGGTADVYYGKGPSTRIHRFSASNTWSASARSVVRFWLVRVGISACPGSSGKGAGVTVIPCLRRSPARSSAM